MPSRRGTEPLTCIETLSRRPATGRCVGIFLLNRSGLVLVGQRRDTAGEAWQMPQGGIDAGETPACGPARDAARRSAPTEPSCCRRARVWRSYDLPAELARRMWRGRYRGQTQKWLAFRFTGSDADIRLDGASRVQRLALGRPGRRCRELIVPFKRDVYLSVVAEFRPLWA